MERCTGTNILYNIQSIILHMERWSKGNIEDNAVLSCISGDLTEDTAFPHLGETNTEGYSG